jgi:hypothetical protein
VFRQLLNLVDIRRYSKVNSAQQRQDTIKLMIEQSANQGSAGEYLSAATELTYRANEAQKDFTKPIALLLDVAAHEALQPNTSDQLTDKATSA